MRVYGFRRFGAYGNLDVAAQSVEELEQAADGIVVGSAVHQPRDVRLGNAQNLAGLRLREPAGLDRAVGLAGYFANRQ